MKRDAELQRRATAQKNIYGDYQSMAGELGGSPALWWQICERGKSSPMGRRLLGLPALPVEVTPCRDCGEVHTLKHCNKSTGRKRRRTTGRDVPGDFDKDMAALLRDMMLAYSLIAIGQVREFYSH